MSLFVPSPAPAVVVAHRTTALSSPATVSVSSRPGHAGRNESSVLRTARQGSCAVGPIVFFGAAKLLRARLQQSSRPSRRLRRTRLPRRVVEVPTASLERIRVDVESQRRAPLEHGQDVATVRRSGAEVVEDLYDSFNRCDADATAKCFTEDVVYEDLLLGASTIVESREEFRELIKTHPVFVGRRLCESLRLPPLDIAVRVDSIAEDVHRGTVGVEWHVEVDGAPLALGRGLSHLKICPKTGLIRRAVDLVEAPWRAIGLIIAPFARGIRRAARLAAFAQFAALTSLFIAVFIFADRPALDELRADIDSLADFRASLDKLSSKDLMRMLQAELQQRLFYVDLPR